MTEVTKELILDLHNKYRAAEKAADMLKMVRWLHDKYKKGKLNGSLIIRIC